MLKLSTADTFDTIRDRLIVLGGPECGLEIRESLIPGAGIGVFATKAFKAREPITEYTGELITHQEALERRKSGKDTHIIRHIPFAYCIDAKMSPDGKRVVTNPAKDLVGRGVGGFVNEGDSKEKRNVCFDHVDSALNLAFFEEADAQYNADAFTPVVLQPLERVKFLRATRDIAAGEELYTSYGNDYWRNSKKRKVGQTK